MSLNNVLTPLSREEITEVELINTTGLSAREERVAIALAEGEFSRNAIMEMYRYKTDAFRTLLASPLFQERVLTLQSQFRQELELIGATNRTHRIRRINARLSKLDQIVNERARMAAPSIDPETGAQNQFHVPDARTAPGASTGLLSRTLKSIGAGLNQQVVPEYSVDEALIRAIERTEEQLAVEMGQRTTKQEITIVPKAYVGIRLEDV